jgi:hypothetical protein
MSIADKNDILTRIKEQKERYSNRLLTNIITDRLTDTDTSIDKIVSEGQSFGFILKEKNRNNLYFSAINESELLRILGKIDSGIYTGFFYKDDYEPYKSIMQRSAWQEYATYFRITIVYDSNPYEIPLTGRKAILQEMYDPDCGEVPDKENIPKLMKLIAEEFDPVVDDSYTEKEWADIIDRRECLICRENDEIITLFVWHVEKNTLYNSMIINRGPANLSYNLERRSFEEAWSTGIRKQYYWTRLDNRQAVARHGKVTNGGAVKSSSVLYNTIYKK